MKLYHGSNRILKHPEYGKGKPYNDYGSGFYCTESIEMAKEWAVTKNRGGFANIYELEDSNLSVLDLNSDGYTPLNWFSILLENRIFDTETLLAAEAKDYILNQFRVPYENYDLIIGYRADDSYFSFAQDFLNGTISYRQLTNAMRLGKLGKQIVLKSQRAFDKLIYLGYETVSSDEYYPRKMQRDRKARSDYFDRERNRRRKDDIYIIHILNGEVDSNALRL